MKTLKVTSGMDAKAPPARGPKKAWLQQIKKDLNVGLPVNFSASSNLSDQSVEDGAPSKRSRIDSFSSLSSVVGEASFSLSGLEDEGSLQLEETLSSSLDFDSSSLYISNSLVKDRRDEFETEQEDLMDASGSGVEDKVKFTDLSPFQGQSKTPPVTEEPVQPDSSDFPNIRKVCIAGDAPHSQPVLPQFSRKASSPSSNHKLGKGCGPRTQTRPSGGWEGPDLHSGQEAVVGSSQEGSPRKKVPRRTVKNKKMPDMMCQVCGDVAAGFYCGAFICEACKKFYMRACKQEKLKYVCLKDKNCVITKESRVQCQYCRFEKCLKLNMYCPKQGAEGENSKDMTMAEIPCRVCSAPSSGFHFGAITCEGCKGFFRRMAKEREPERYQCTKSGACEINMITRNLCKACRYSKCLDQGMSVEGSRIGRQPNSVKHAMSLELKQKVKVEPASDYEDVKEENAFLPCLHSGRREPVSDPPAESLMAQGKPLSWSADSPVVDISLDPRSPVEGQSVTRTKLPPNINKMKVAMATEEVKRKRKTSGPNVPAPGGGAKAHTETVPDGKQTVPPRTESGRQQSSSSSSTKKETVALSVPSVSKKPDESQLDWTDWTPLDNREMVQGIIEAGKVLPLFNYRIFDTEIAQNGKIEEVMAKFQNKYMGTETGRKEAKPNWSRLLTTEDIWEYTMNSFNHNAYITIRFAKKIPGFRQLLMNDQVKLIQAAIYPLVLLNHSRVFDLETKQYNYFNFTKEEEELVMQKFPMLTVLQEHFVHIGTLVKTYKFTDEEFTLLSALILLPSEIPRLERPNDVQKLQTLISEALQHYEEKSFKDGLTRYGVLLVRVAELIQCSLQHNLAVSLLLAQNPTVRVPQLYQEIIMANVKESFV